MKKLILAGLVGWAIALVISPKDVVGMFRRTSS